MNTCSTHTFHIPVMGIGYTIDSPIKVAQYGISSVISLVDDMLLEKIRNYYCRTRNKQFTPISKKVPDFRAKRITAYLNLVDEIVREKIADFRQVLLNDKQEVDKYLDYIPDQSDLKKNFAKFSKASGFAKAKEWLVKQIHPGNIDVNIMTKLDKRNYDDDEMLPIDFADAHAAMRGFGNSKLNSSVVLSAGMNPRLYSYMQNFPDFFPDEQGELKKRITLKVSDYRSALIQGKFLAKKGLWVSEYRLESGLNCGGHAFATDGYLMGPILEEFSDNRENLVQTVFGLYSKALAKQGYPTPDTPNNIRLSAQGGVGTAEEHRFLLDHYGVDSVGWGTPFLLVPEAVNIDDDTRELLSEALEDDLYLSGISPLGVPFNSLKGNTKDLEKQDRINRGIPGSACPKKYVELNTEFTDKNICTASRQYQYLKLQELDERNLDPNTYQEEYDSITDKSCICVGLGTSALLSKNLDTRVEGKGVSICPGPNMAYFSKTVSLRSMVKHIYGRANVMTRTDRPHMFLKELSLYVDYLKEKVREQREVISEQKSDWLLNFRDNLNDGITYYRNLFTGLDTAFTEMRSSILDELDRFQRELHKISIQPYPALQSAIGS